VIVFLPARERGEVSAQRTEGSCLMTIAVA